MHEFVTAGEAAEIIEHASPRLMRSQMVGSGLNGTLDDRRVSPVHFFPVELQCPPLNSTPSMIFAHFDVKTQ